jgi:FHS family L-fucose permease-like MFS transporter
MVVILLSIYLTRMPHLKEDDKRLDFTGTFRRLKKNGNYMWAVVAQFFYVGAQIAVWSFIIRYVMQQMQLDAIIASIGPNPTTAQIIEKLRHLEPVAAGFYNFLEFIGLTALLPRTAEQAGATYYIMSLCLFVIGRFVCTWLMRFIKPRQLLTGLSVIAVILSLTAIYGRGFIGVYALVGISGCMSLMFPTIYALGIDGLGEDTKLGGAGMIMAIAGAAFLTQIQGIVSDQSGSIIFAYWVPAIAFMVVGFYAAVVARRHEALKMTDQYKSHKP